MGVCYKPLESAEDMAASGLRVLNITFTSLSWFRKIVVESSRALRLCTVAASEILVAAILGEALRTSSATVLTTPLHDMAKAAHGQRHHPRASLGRTWSSTRPPAADDGSPHMGGEMPSSAA